jgi:hypothetical protein
MPGASLGQPDRFAAPDEWADLSRRRSEGQGSPIRRGVRQGVHEYGCCTPLSSLGLIQNFHRTCRRMRLTGRQALGVSGMGGEHGSSSIHGRPFGVTAQCVGSLPRGRPRNSSESSVNQLDARPRGWRSVRSTMVDWRNAYPFTPAWRGLLAAAPPPFRDLDHGAVLLLDAAVIPLPMILLQPFAMLLSKSLPSAAPVNTGGYSISDASSSRRGGCRLDVGRSGGVRAGRGSSRERPPPGTE